MKTIIIILFAIFLVSCNNLHNYQLRGKHIFIEKCSSCYYIKPYSYDFNKPKLTADRLFSILHSEEFDVKNSHRIELSEKECGYIICYIYYLKGWQ